jgi:hypothetical protein
MVCQTSSFTAMGCNSAVNLSNFLHFLWIVTSKLYLKQQQPIYIVYLLFDICYKFCSILGLRWWYPSNKTVPTLRQKFYPARNVPLPPTLHPWHPSSTAFFWCSVTTYILILKSTWHLRLANLQIHVFLSVIQLIVFNFTTKFLLFLLGAYPSHSSCFMRGTLPFSHTNTSRHTPSTTNCFYKR